MDEATLLAIIHAVTRVVEVAGIAVILLGMAFALVRHGIAAARGAGSYHRLRSDLGRSILLGLELLVAADIINTVAIEPTLESIAVLAGIIAIRTFLSFTLELEIDGQWPWQRGARRE